MISIQVMHRGNAAKAGHYYADQKDDYYSQDGKSAQWQGRGAQLVGLEGEIAQAQFVATMRGDFGEGVNLSRSIRKDAKARAAIDVTFSAPKSISMQALIGKDPTVLAAHDHAVHAALEYLERELVRARQKENGLTRSEKTGNAIMAKFRHETARPTEFDDADPQLHTHTLVMNITQRADGAWVAMSNEAIYRAKLMLDLIYKNEMATYLERAGYALRYERDSFELAHISRAQIEHFSKRGMTVQSELAKIGKNRKTASRALKQAITLATRNEKRPEITRETLQEGWENDSRKVGIDFGLPNHRTPQIEPKYVRPSGHELPGPNGPAPSGSGPTPGLAPEALPGVGQHPDLSGAPAAPVGPGSPSAPVAPVLATRIAEECVAWAIHHLSERESIMSQKKLLVTAMEHAIGTGSTYWEIKAAIDSAVAKGHLVNGAPVYRSDLNADSEAVFSREAWVQKMVLEGATPEEARLNVRRAIARGGLVIGDVHYTTQAAREREKRILQIEREGRGQVAPIMDVEAARAALANKGLRPGQLAAAELALTTSNRIVGVQGLAGVGKSYMLQHVVDAAESASYTVKSIAPYGSQVKELRRLGVEAVTVASMLEAHTNRFTLDANTILVIDEAGVVPTRQKEKILQRAERAGARVILMGDINQTKAIEAGRPLHQLQDAGMETALMGDIVRQTDPTLRSAVEMAAKGRASEALHVLQTKLGALREVKDTDRRYDSIAKRYSELPAKERRATLVITGTNDSRNALNDLIHEKLGLCGAGFNYMLLTRVDTTQAQRRSARYYIEGNVVQPERNYKNGLTQDTQYRVVNVDTARNRITVVPYGGGEPIEFNPSRTTKLSVFEPVTAELSAGDAVRITRNDAKLDLVNGERYQVLAVTPGTVKLGRLNESGAVTREVSLNADPKLNPLHMDRAYASTVHSAQGLSETGVILNQETFSRTTKADVFYVAISREREWIELFTDDMTKLPFAVARQEEKAAALDIGIAQRVPEIQLGPKGPTAQPSQLSI